MLTSHHHPKIIQGCLTTLAQALSWGLINFDQWKHQHVLWQDTNLAQAFVPAFEVVNGVPKGPVTIELKALDADTKTDQNDFFRVTVEEQPRG